MLVYKKSYILWVWFCNNNFMNIKSNEYILYVSKFKIIEFEVY